MRAEGTRWRSAAGAGEVLVAGAGRDEVILGRAQYDGCVSQASRRKYRPTVALPGAAKFEHQLTQEDAKLLVKDEVARWLLRVGLVFAPAATTLAGPPRAFTAIEVEDDKGVITLVLTAPGVEYRLPDGETRVRRAAEVGSYDLLSDLR